MLYFDNLFSLSFQLRNNFGGRTDSQIKFIVIAYNKDSKNFRIYYYNDMHDVKPFYSRLVILVCYYAPGGDWNKYYGDDWCWNLSPRRIALDILNNTLQYNQNFIKDGSDVLPSWLRKYIEGLL